MLDVMLKSCLPEHMLSNGNQSRNHHDRVADGQNSYHHQQGQYNNNYLQPVYSNTGSRHGPRHFLQTHQHQTHRTISVGTYGGGTLGGNPETLFVARPNIVAVSKLQQRARRSSESIYARSQNTLKRLSSIWNISGVTNSVMSGSSASSSSGSSGYNSSSNINNGNTAAAMIFDQCDNLAGHTQKGIEFLERYNSFVKDRCQVETEYATKLKGSGQMIVHEDANFPSMLYRNHSHLTKLNSELARKLVKQYHPKKKEEDRDSQLTYVQAFYGVLSELNDIANQHELIADNLRDEIQLDIAKISKELKEQRKTYLVQAEKLQSTLDAYLNHLEKTKKEYQKAFKEAEAAHNKYKKAEADLNLSRIEVQKARDNAHEKSQQAEEAKGAYALQLQRTNELQSDHYRTLLPQVFENLREMDEGRVNRMRTLLLKEVEIQQNVLPIIQRCLSCMTDHANQINATTDSSLVVTRYQSGVAPPVDIAFIDLSCSATVEDGSLHSSNGQLNNGNGQLNSSSISHSGTGTITGRKPQHKKPGLKGFFKSKQIEQPKEDFSGLQPMQRCRKLEAKLEDLQNKYQHLQNSRDGMLKLQTTYETNPQKGNLADVNNALAANAQEIQLITNEIEKFKAYLEEAQAQLNTPANVVMASPATPGRQYRTNTGPTLAPSSNLVTGQAQHYGSHTQRSSVSEDSLSRSASESSVSHPGAMVNGIHPHVKQNGANGTIRPSSNSSSLSPESGIADRNSGTYSDNDRNSDDQLYIDAELLPVLGVAIALFNFDGVNDGTISITEGEELKLIDRDEGDGWTRIRKHCGDEGFVPSSYLQCHYTS